MQVPSWVVSRARAIVVVLCGLLLVGGNSPSPSPSVTAAVDPTLCPTCRTMMTKLATGVYVTSIVAGDSNVFFTSDLVSPPSRLQKVPVTGGSVSTLRNCKAPASSLVSDGTNLYWHEASQSTGADIYARPKASGPEQLLLSDSALSTRAQQALALVSGGKRRLLFANSDTSRLFLLTKEASGWQSKKLIPELIPNTGTNYYPLSVVADGSYAYFARDVGEIYRVLLDGTAPAEFLAPCAKRTRLALDGVSLYYSTDNRIKKIPLAGGVATNVATVTEAPSAMVLDGGFLYWACKSCGTVTRTPLSGGLSKTMLGNAESPQALAVNATRLFVGTAKQLVSVAK